jgi:hypothetical protein
LRIDMRALLGSYRAMRMEPPLDPPDEDEEFCDSCGSSWLTPGRRTDGREVVRCMDCTYEKVVVADYALD